MSVIIYIFSPVSVTYWRSHYCFVSLCAFSRMLMNLFSLLAFSLCSQRNFTCFFHHLCTERLLNVILIFRKVFVSNFYILLTVHLGIILVNNQLDAQFFCMCLFRYSTCFEQPYAHHQENQLNQYDIWYMSLYVGDRLVCRFGRTSKAAYQTVTYIKWYISDILIYIRYWYNWISWWWALECSKHVENWNKHKKELCVKLVIKQN